VRRERQKAAATASRKKASQRKGDDDEEKKFFSGFFLKQTSFSLGLAVMAGLLRRGFFLLTVFVLFTTHVVVGKVSPSSCASDRPPDQWAPKQLRSCLAAHSVHPPKTVTVQELAGLVQRFGLTKSDAPQNENGVWSMGTFRERAIPIMKDLTTVQSFVGTLGALVLSVGAVLCNRHRGHEPPAPTHPPAQAVPTSSNVPATGVLPGSDLDEHYSHKYHIPLADCARLRLVFQKYARGQRGVVMATQLYAIFHELGIPLGELTLQGADFGYEDALAWAALNIDWTSRRLRATTLRPRYAVGAVVDIRHSNGGWTRGRVEAVNADHYVVVQTGTRGNTRRRGISLAAALNDMRPAQP